MDSLYAAKNLWPRVYKRIVDRLKNKEMDDWWNVSINNDTHTVEIDGTRLQLFDDKCVITYSGRITIMHNSFGKNIEESIADAAVNTMIWAGKKIRAGERILV